MTAAGTVHPASWLMSAGTGSTSVAPASQAVLGRTDSPVASALCAQAQALLAVAAAIENLTDKIGGIDFSGT